MGDPLSIASGVAGIVSLGLTVCSGLQTYFSALKDRGEDIQQAHQLLTLLSEYIDLIRPIESMYGNRHGQATNLIALALRLCQGELQVLKETIDKLECGKGTWEKSKLVVTYPFNQKKLTQVQDQLFKTTGALGTVFHVLVLRENTSISNDIDALRNAVRDSILFSQEVFGRIQTEVEQNRAMAVSTHELIQSVSVTLLEKLDSVVQGQAQLLWVQHERQITEPTRQIDAPQHLKNADLETKSIQAHTAGTCSCEEARRKTSKQSLQRYKLWGGLTVLRQVDRKRDHERGCRFYREELLERSTKTTFTYTGLRYILSLALNLTVERQCENGDYSIKHSLRTYNMREKSEAFEVFRWSKLPDNFSTTLVEELMTELQEAYSLPDVSPRDVDEFGRNTAHLCITGSGHLLYNSTSSGEAGQLLDGLETLLSFLSKVMHVDIFVGENHNGSMLGYLVANGFPSLLPRVYDVFRRLKPEFDPGCDQKAMWDHLEFRNWERRRHLKMFRDTFHDRPDIIEDLGYGELFLAISKRDKSKLQQLINSPSFAKYLDERDFFQHNVLHLCINWKDGLKLLLQQRVTHCLANESDFLRFTPLHYALIHSGKAYYSADGTIRGKCCEPLEMLLSTDCRIFLNTFSNIALEDSSPDGAMLLLQHLKLRRERLRDLAMTHLSKSDLRDLGVTKNELPDTAAAELWDRLQLLYQKGTIRELHDALNPLNPLTQDNPQYDRRRSLFHCLTSPRDAEMAFNIGFQSIDAPDSTGVTPILSSSLHHAHPLGAYQKYVIYDGWLIAKGAKLDYSINSLKLSAAHRLAQVSAWWARADYAEGSAGTRMPPGVYRVLSAVCGSKLESSLPCPCSPRKLSRPLHYFFAMALEDVVNSGYGFYYMSPFGSYPKAIHLAVHLVGLLDQATTTSLDMAYMAKSIIHLLTMNWLGIRHLERCNAVITRNEDEVQTIREEEEWDYMLDEGRCLTEELEKLTAEFEQEFISQKVSIEEFLWNHWLKKMREKWKKREPLSKKQKQDLGDIGVDMESDSESDCDLYDPDFDEGESVLPILARGRLMREKTD
ncbi:hypothetical protein CDV31_007023 [Fusarium ambrosium]|uniref:Fungal N-terminal domain-containing protein n=1 Tax=Fusarium ambrosium TaxID=131363 RepID=A0A428U9D1_9HYPO|nr:hypothetical protein CDV31_007023 [Fusarium ambrosium]